MPQIHRPPRVGEHCYYDTLLRMGFWSINHDSGRCHFSTPVPLEARRGLEYGGEVCTIHLFQEAPSRELPGLRRHRHR